MSGIDLMRDRAAKLAQSVGWHIDIQRSLSNDGYVKIMAFSDEGGGTFISEMPESEAWGEVLYVLEKQYEGVQRSRRVWSERKRLV